ncbi:hypothetical protein SBY92_000345 [Candida maltosa Xu316]
MAPSFYEQEQKKIKNAIKLPLLELVLKFLPHLQPTIQAKDDTWEIVAIQLTNLRYSEILANKPSPNTAKGSKKSNGNNVVEEIESIPELNGIYVRDYYEELFANFKKNIVFMINLNRSENLQGRPGNDMGYLIKDRGDALLYELYKLEYKDIELISKISSETLEDKLRKHLEKLYKVSENGDAMDQDEEVDDGILDSKELLEHYRNSSVRDKNKMLQDQIVKQDKKLEQLKDENQRLLELNHELLEQMNGR